MSGTPEPEVTTADLIRKADAILDQLAILTGRTAA